MIPSTFPYCNHTILNDQFMWLYRQAQLLDRAPPGTPAFIERLGALAASVRNQFVLEEDLLRNLSIDHLQDQVVDHVQLLCYLRFLLGNPAATPKLATLHDDFRIMLRRHLFEKDRIAVSRLNDALDVIDVSLMGTDHAATTPGAIMHHLLALPWGTPRR